MKDQNINLDILKKYVDSIEIKDNEKKELVELIQNIEYDIHKICFEKEANKSKCDFYETAIDVLPNPVFLKNEEGKFVFLNLAYQNYFGIEPRNYLDKTVLDLEYLPIEERERYQNEDLQLIQSGEVKHYECDFELADGIAHSLYWSRGFQAHGCESKGLIGEIVDISVQKKLQEEISCNAKKLQEANSKIEKMMSQDCLTGLYNRRVIEDNIEKINHMVNQDNVSVSLIMADLDNFKIVNDTFGHQVGDSTLASFSMILMSCNRKEDMVVRYGGEEFLVILFGTTTDDAKQIAERIRIQTEKSLKLPNGRTNTVSLGVTEMRADEVFDMALERADDALYAAKKTGKNKVVFK